MKNNEMVSNNIVEVETIKFQNLLNENKISLKIVAIIIGENFASKLYLSKKKLKALELNVNFSIKNFSVNSTQKDIVNYIKKLNVDKNVHGIMIQLPLPKQFDKDKIINTINYMKDIDGLTYINKGMMEQDINSNMLISPVAKSIMTLVSEYNIDVSHKKVVVIGTGEVAGFPISMIFKHLKATVTMCNINTINLSDYTINADIIVSAVGLPNIIKIDDVKDGVILFGVGIVRVGNKVEGDYDFESMKIKSKLITTPKNSIGPLTVLHLMKNAYISYKLLNNLDVKNVVKL